MAAADSQWTCDDCEESFYDVKDLITHIQSHTYRCKYCNRRFTSRTKFVEHVELHDAVHECPICGTMFRSRKEMVTHKRSHQAKAWSCKICQKPCKSELNLTNHMAQHKCVDDETAESAVMSEDVLEEDPKKAIDLRLWPCPVCSKMFKKKGNLTKHKKLHGEQAAPMEDEHKDLSNQNEEEVEDNVTEKAMDLRIWPCEKCKKTFKKKGNLRIHMMNKHCENDPLEGEENAALILKVKCEVEPGDGGITEPEDDRNGVSNLDQVDGAINDESEVLLEVEPNEVGMMDSEDDRNAMDSFDQVEAAEVTGSV